MKQLLNTENALISAYYNRQKQALKTPCDSCTLSFFFQDDNTKIFVLFKSMYIYSIYIGN